MSVDLSALVVRCATAELELQAKGYSQQESELGANWAYRWALGMMRTLPLAQQESAYPALFEQAMVSATDYLDGCRRAVAQREYSRGIRRAAKDGEFKRGVRDYGPAKAVDQAWKGSLEVAESNWERKFRPAAG